MNDDRASEEPKLAPSSSGPSAPRRRKLLVAPSVLALAQLSRVPAASSLERRLLSDLTAMGLKPVIHPQEQKAAGRVPVSGSYHYPSGYQSTRECARRMRQQERQRHKQAEKRVSASHSSPTSSAAASPSTTPER